MAKSDRITLLADQVMVRIRPYCQHMTVEELRSLAERMAAIEYKYAMTDHWPFIPR